jgi:hypothetical protein
VAQLDIRPHRAVEDEDALGDGAEIWMQIGISHGAKKEKAQTRCAGLAL